ncbi:hypothetical protein LB572_13805 [Mesorhizobium sp. BH1-1-5]|uniref:hypothetical protein n=1 Tax=Mesorhizobium sp. BH1-1-5 TaxID=2876661 RepID=UPI001CCFD9E6|nr:hypothetical protein [Mesorhizobium sp. BH1-1-5]MBZ9988167.1 hypothetical protein [Mesorhizobium sp. BH1-1-5]
MALLTYVVEETLAGRGRELKEAVIGNTVYRREPPYDPRVDSTVRVEARRLRRKLLEHISNYGQSDSLTISIPTGSYTPVFRWNDGLEGPGPADSDQSPKAIFRRGPGTLVAVMPMRPISPDPSTMEFADSLTDELMYALGSEPGISIQSRSVTFAFKDKQLSIPELATELGVNAVVQGTVRDQAGAIRVTIEVADPRGFVVTSDRFEGASEDRIVLPERIATTLVSRLRFDSSKMRAREISPGPVAIQSHAKVYRARQLLDRQVPESLREALAIFTDVAETAPDYARGHSGIADCHCDMFRIGILDAKSALARARPAATRALEIDPQSTEALTALATVQAWLERDRKAAEASFEAALQFGYSSRTARVYGSYLAALGLADDAERMFREARRIEPFSQQQDIAEAVSRFQSRRFDSMRIQGQTVALRNAPIEALFYLALGNHFGKNDEGARECAKPLSHVLASHPQIVFADVEIEAWLGRPDRAVSLLRSGNHKASHFAHASLAASVADEASVFEHLTSALDRRELATVWMRTDVRFDFVRNAREYKSLLDRLEAMRIS